MTKTLCIVGGGPKAAAIVARAVTLRRLGAVVPDTIVIEKEDIGAAWSGSAGFSNGTLTLCSPGEKDVGFPYSDIMTSPSRRGVARDIHICVGAGLASV